MSEGGANTDLGRRRGGIGALGLLKVQHLQPKRMNNNNNQ